MLKFRLYPNKAQKQKLEETLEDCRCVYNTFGCREKVEKNLSDRIHECPYCGLVLDRDLNASRNILRIGRESPESKPEREEISTQLFGVEQISLMKQEATQLVGW